MDLNKDNKNVYTVDPEVYSEYMHENIKKPSSTLNSIVKILLLILLIVLGGFYYKILKEDLSFSEVFNKKEFFSIYSFLDKSEQTTKSVLMENNIEVLAQEKVIVKEKKTESSLVKKEEEVIVKKEEPVVEKTTIVLTEEVKKELPVIEKVEVSNIEVVQKVIEQKTPASNTPTSDILSDSYLDKMVEELNSL